MAKFHITIARPDGFIHTAGFAEIIDSLSWSLSALGHEVIIAENAFSADGHNILFGAELLSPEQKLPANVVIFQLEQPTHPNFKYVQQLAQGRKIWEYNLSNMRQWRTDGYDVIHIPVGYTPNLTKIPKAATQDIDVFFSGWITDRRQKIVNDLRTKGMNVVAVNLTYGGARDQLISRAKVCLNMNHDGRTHFNIQRVSFLMANSKCIVTEHSSDQHNYGTILQGMADVVPYNQLVDACVRLVANKERRELFEKRSFEIFSQIDFVETVRQAVAELPKPNAILARYEEGCREGDMKEYLPFIRDNAKGKCLEIGVRDGGSTSAFLLGLEKNGGHLTSIDLADCSGLWEHPQWTFIQANTQTTPWGEILGHEHEHDVYDMALVDGDHSREGYLRDLNACYAMVRNNGLILSHDIAPAKTLEKDGGDYPSVAIGEEFKKFADSHGLVSFTLPGTYGMGVMVRK